VLNEHFEKLGLSDKERSVYMTLAELGKTSASKIAQETSIPRATVYSVLSSLGEQGLTAAENVSTGTLFSPAKASAFTRLIERRRQQLDEQAETAKELERLLAPFIATSEVDAPRFLVLEGKKNIENMLYENLEQWRESMRVAGDHTLWGFQDNSIVEEFERWHRHMWKTRSNEERIHLFTNEPEKDIGMQHNVPKRIAKKLPVAMDFKSSTWLYGDYLIIISTWKKPQYAVQLKDKVFASNFRTLFKLMWYADFNVSVADEAN